jgi:hypothetical protein
LKISEESDDFKIKTETDNQLNYAINYLTDKMEEKFKELTS